MKTCTIALSICRKCYWKYHTTWKGAGEDRRIANFCCEPIPAPDNDNVCPECRAHPETMASRRAQFFEDMRDRLNLTQEDFDAQYGAAVARVAAEEFK